MLCLGDDARGELTWRWTWLVGFQVVLSLVNRPSVRIHIPSLCNYMWFRLLGKEAVALSRHIISTEGPNKSTSNSMTEKGSA